LKATRFARPIRHLLPEMKIRAANLLLLLALVALAGIFCGCASTEPDNTSVRPWNSSEGWQGGALGGMDYQRR